ncbi:MAG: monomethylamine:corrinoid methyltransferase [Eubacteriales bacterium]|nr:monomethylamine:corrinoid methyltransferase [Eubacteriales bacterium]
MMDSKQFFDLCKRSKRGKKIEKGDWDLDYITIPVKNLVEKYDLHWEKENLIPEDPEMFGRMFEAAKELITTVGMYNMSTKKVIHFTEEEIEQGLHDMSTELVMGEGKDAYILVPRGIEDEKAPAIWAGNPGCPTPENLYYEVVKSVAQEPIIDLLTCGSLIDVDGHKVKNGEVTEILAVRRELDYLRKVLDEVGRPGMGLLAAESAVTEIGDLAAISEGRLRPCDSHLVSFFNELIVDNGNLLRAANKLGYGMRNASLACAMIGGMAGDAPGACLVMIASIMAANLIGMADYHLCHPIHITDIATTSRSCLWLQSVLCQTFATKAPALIVCDLWPASGAMTKELLYEVAANAIVVTVSGGHLEGVGATAGSVPNGTGLEVRFMGEIGKAVAAQHMTRKEANEIVLKLLDKYEHIFKAPGSNWGVRFDEAYDMETIQPLPEWNQMYEEVKAELAEMGIHFL